MCYIYRRWRFFLKNKNKKDVKVHEIVVAAIIMEMIREQASTICLARV